MLIYRAYRLCTRVMSNRDIDSFIFESSYDNDKLVIFFGGSWGGLGIKTPPFEFVKTTKFADYNKIFVRDVFQLWYHKGLYGFTGNIAETIDFLANIVENGEFSKVCCVGNSAGGFASILFGVNINADIIHAFSPQTFLNLPLKLRYRDFRWKKMTYYLYRNKMGKMYLDLYREIMDKNYDTKIFVHYCMNNRLDEIHAKRIEGCSGVKLLGYPCDDHEAAKHIRNYSYLGRIIESEDYGDLERLNTEIFSIWKK